MAILTGGKAVRAIGPSLAFASAVEDALGPLAVKIIDLPLKPEKVGRLIHLAKQATEKVVIR
jgi:hypothetical protein